MGLKAGRVGIHPSQVDPITGMLINGPTPGSISFEDLSDAQISNPEVGQTLIYNGTGWENEFSSISPTTLSALQDVQITDPEDGDYLMYDSENSKWINSGEAPGPTFTDITVTMYGAVEDTISFTDAAGIAHTEVFASGQSSKFVTFKINPTGSTSITFTSAVAKDPDNLSNDYTKTVSVTSATTSIYVMPNDNVLYWYGYNDGISEHIGTTAIGSSATSRGTVTFNKNNITCVTTIAQSYAEVVSDSTFTFSNYTNLKCICKNVATNKTDTEFGTCSYSGQYYGSFDRYTVKQATTTCFDLALTSTSTTGRVYAGCTYSADTFTMDALWLE